jgi:colicin import membrane protein
MAEFLRNNWAYLVGAALLHVVFAAIFGLTLLSIAWKPQPAALAIQAVVVDRSIIDRASRQQQRDRAQEQARQQELKRQQEQERQQEQQRQDEQRKQQERREAEQQAEQTRQQEVKQREAEQQRKQAEEQQARQRQETERKAQAAEAERQRKAAEERKRVEEIERKQKEEAERRKAADDARERDQRESDLRKQLEEEEGRSQAEKSGLLNEYIALIEQRIVRNWNRPPSARPGLECRVKVAQAPGGAVLSVPIDQCTGDEAVRQSIEAAVMRSSPLPPPPDPRLFERNLVLVFKPEE